MSSTNIKQNVLNTVTLVLEEIITRIKETLDDTQYVYDEALTYETAIKKFRDDNNMNDDNKSPLPLFAFKRSVLRYAEQMGGIGRRSTTKKITYPNPDQSEGSAPYISANLLQAEFDVDFAYICRDMQDLERFEVAYTAFKGFSQGAQLVAHIPELKESLSYQLDFKDPLSDKTINTQDNYFKTILGRFTIRGYYLVFKGKVNLIQSISFKIREEDEILQECLITPES